MPVFPPGPLEDVRREAGRVQVAVHLQAGGDSGHAPCGCVTGHVRKAFGFAGVAGILAQGWQTLADVFMFEIDAEAARPPFRFAVKPFGDRDSAATIQWPE